MSAPRTRLAAVAGSLALSLSLVSAPVALAQDGPEATVEGFLATFETLDVEAMGSFLCPELNGAMGALDLSQITDGMPEGMDIGTVLDAFAIDTEIDSLEVVSQTDTEAIVRLVATMSMDIVPENLVPLIEILLEMSGMPVDADTVEMFTGMMLADFEAETTAIDEEITLVPGDEMAWVICSELGAMGTDPSGDAMADESMAPAMDEDASTTDE